MTFIKKHKIAIVIIFIVLLFCILAAFFLSGYTVTINYVNAENAVVYSETKKFYLGSKAITADAPLGYKDLGFGDDRSGSVKVNKNSVVTCYVDYDYLSMPVLNIDTNNAPINSDEEYTECSVDLLNAADDSYEFLDKAAGIRLRGNSTQGTSKKPYRIKFDSKTSLLGLNNGGKFKSWVLLADYFDPSMSRNATSFFIGSYLRFYTSSYHYVEVYLNNEYQGVYILCEQQQINSGRIDIEEYSEGESDPLDTGYLLENDYYYFDKQGEIFIECNINGAVFDYTHWLIKSDTLSNGQLLFIKDFMNEVYNAAWNGGESDVRGLIDIDSAVDMTVLDLIKCDMDSNSSFYVYKDKNGKLCFGAPWDEDMAYGIVKSFESFDNAYVNHIFSQLLTQKWFFDLVKARFNELTEQGLINDMLANISNIATVYRQEFKRNDLKWKLIGKRTFGDNQINQITAFKNQEDAANQLKDWLNNHCSWLKDVYFNR